MKKVLVVGASGLVGRAVAANLEADHTVVRASRSSGDVRVDVLDPSSVQAMFETVGEVDAIVTVTGRQAYGPLSAITSEEIALGLTDKVMGQINVVLAGQSALRESGTITMTSGVMSDPPFPGGIGAHTDNAAIESFARVAATELTGNRRINVVSPAVVIPSWDEPLPAHLIPAGLFQVTAPDLALSYRSSIEDGHTGEVYKVWGTPTD
ncbi:short chain dehydrogenase [Isoptericola sp. NPDC019482]|uniref:short chain dehydrogenase n=1 Tax=Isoptericola sp. NPDC019482 TaxID=3154688 RepID=UPI003482A317